MGQTLSFTYIKTVHLSAQTRVSKPAPLPPNAGRKPESTRQSSVFLLYSYDSDDHYAKVCALYKFLTDVPGLEVAFDAAEANEMGVPHLWLTNQLHNVDHVVLVVSEGVYDKVEKGKRPPHEHHPWGDQVYTAVLEIIRDERLHNKLIKVIAGICWRIL